MSGEPEREACTFCLWGDCLGEVGFSVEVMDLFREGTTGGGPLGCAPPITKVEKRRRRKKEKEREREREKKTAKKEFLGPPYNKKNKKQKQKQRKKPPSPPLPLKTPPLKCHKPSISLFCLDFFFFFF